MCREINLYQRQRLEEATSITAAVDRDRVMFEQLAYVLVKTSLDSRNIAPSSSHQLSLIVLLAVHLADRHFTFLLLIPTRGIRSGWPGAFKTRG